MSVQSVSSAPAAPDTGVARKRAAAADEGRASAPFALPEETEAAAPSTTPKGGAAAEAKAAEPKAAEPKSGGASAAGAKPVQIKDNASGTAAPPPRTGKAAAILIVPEPDGATVQATPAEAVPVQTGANALLAAAIAAQAEGSVKADADESGEDDDKTAEGTEPVVGDPAAGLIIVAAPAAGVAEPVAATSAAGIFAAAASSGAKAPGAGAATAGVDAAAQPATAAAGGATTASVEASGVLALTAGSIAKKDTATAPLHDGEADKLTGDEAGAAASASGAGQSSATHPVKAAAADPISPLAPQDVAQQPEIKLPDGLQSLQGLIDLSAQARQARPDAGPAVMTPEQAAAQAANAQAQAATAGPPTPLHVVPIEIGLRALAGGRKFDIRLDPAELGRVDVSLDISDKGEVTAKLVVDRVETLHMLQRDARTLERAFEQAGLKPSSAGVDITLRDPGDQSGFRQNRQQDEAPRRMQQVSDIGDDIGLAAQPVPATSVRGLIRLGGVDLSI